MWQIILNVVAGLNLATAAVIWFAPLRFYETVPGVALTGAFNGHFLRDVALAYLVSGVALWVAARRCDRVLGLFAVAWPACHALFHLWAWATHRKAALDLITLSDFLGVLLPAALSLAAVLHIHNKEGMA